MQEEERRGLEQVEGELYEERRKWLLPYYEKWNIEKQFDEVSGILYLSKSACLYRKLKGGIDRGSKRKQIFSPKFDNLTASTAAEAQQINRIIGIASWLMIVRLEFSDLLKQRRAEALVILAHYALLLHRFRDCWMFGYSRRFVIDSISQ
jgi:hypothetical protein